jgi:hypothetical protein
LGKNPDFCCAPGGFGRRFQALRKQNKETAMMMRTDFQASGHRPLDMKDFNASVGETDGLPAHPRLSSRVARPGVAVVLLGAACAMAVVAVLAALFSMG